MRRYENVKIDELIPYEYNARTHSEEQVERIAKSIEEFGFINPILVDSDYGIIAGHGRVLGAKKLGMDKLPCLFIEDLTEAQKKAYILADNKLALDAGWDDEILTHEFTALNELGMDINLTGFNALELEEFGINGLGDEEMTDSDEKEHGSLVDRFMAPPFSILDTRQGYWQDRKRMWRNKGIQSEVGRGEELLGNLGQLAEDYNSSPSKQLHGTSIFDPALTEIMYKWFCVDNGSIFDCFAGGSVRGAVAAWLGYQYTGIELRKEQVEANEQYAAEQQLDIKYICDDSRNMDKYIKDESYDLIFSCPPYADLEVYSDDERDISNMEYADFCAAYKDIITKACNKLKNDRFAVFVVGDVRDKDGFYRGFVDYTKQCFIDSGLRFYNDLVLVGAVGTASMRAGRQFSTGRKVVKTHQNVLVFYKGNPKNIKDNFGDIYIDEDLFKED